MDPAIKSVLDLPNKMLIAIFEFLFPSDRRVTSECCKRFLEIWLRDQFIEDRCLNFRECILDPELEPCSIILESQRSYKYLVLYDVTFHDGLDELWKKLGKTVTTIELSRSDWPNKKFWESFPKLEALSLAGEIPENYNFSFLPQSLQKISFTVFGMDGIIDEALKALDENYLKFRSKAISLEFDRSVYFRDLHFIQKYHQDIQKVSIYVNDMMKSDFLYLYLPNLKHLDLHLSDDIYYQRAALDNLEEWFPDLEHLECNFLPHRDWHHLKILYVDNTLHQDLPRLKSFVNLEELYLNIIGHTECFFVHEPYLIRSLKKLTLNASVLTSTVACLTCFKAMTETFSNLENLESELIITNEHLELIAENLPKLNNLVLTKSLTEEQPEERLSFQNLPKLSSLHLFWWEMHGQPNLETWPLMSHLRKLTINFKQLNRINATLFQMVPALEDLRFECNYIDDDGILLMMVAPLKRLRRLKFSTRTNLYCSNQMLSGIVNNCQYLRVISLGYRCKVDVDFKEYAKDILKEHSSIRHFEINEELYKLKDFQKISDKNGWKKCLDNAILPVSSFVAYISILSLVHFFISC